MSQVYRIILISNTLFPRIVSIVSSLEYLPYSNFQKKELVVSSKIQYLINFRSNSTLNPLNSTIEELMCCSGFCIDLLAKFGEELQFEYDLIRVTDPKWGVLKVRKVLFFLTRKAKFYIPCIITIWKKVPTRAIWADKNWADFWQISLYIQ